ncbi:NAD(P)H-dependent glycerol-3-phosphate dehydrogenase [Ponticaulis sp.]|uniref:NAD(P)H-dependent glycerol-3-phosphate dehydrogenase n=1 Tax=Ponticaulis sp. TaxID=2020902 RepID=UPI000B660C2F|nr:NAD(P)H-dependent glycerol-3-phosphate dehydrogenase [Ponticaulis sp.]MAI90688.1 glycerol-3-phosphate dehydrogenase [Ponticaulis sp.]OUX99193.1 MAG: glycerol-3-phosphate dehydrogenase [Hyphomonadaceae bacterium TMED5]|tara:strand:- start:21872 stop:22870 length:999 start_codon:yes stop_codon:yes gene_type:complete
MTFNRIGVLGAGAWGTALAYTAQAAGRDVLIWSREGEVADALSSGKGNPVFLPEVDLPAIPATSDLAALKDVDAILAVVPAQFARSVFTQLNGLIPDDMPFALCAKGVEHGSLKLMAEVLSETRPQAPVAVLSGPSFAKDVAAGLPTAVTLACEDEALGHRWMESIGRPEFRPYYSPDLIGAEIGGAVKNVLAIACGAVEGLQLGKSAHAALISRGFAEMVRLGTAMGAQAETLAGLCGLGDLVLTCSSPQSRNMSFGKALGEGKSPSEILASRKAVTEGVATAPGVVSLAKSYGIEMPICEAVADILAEKLTLKEAMASLIERPFTSEQTG